MKLNKKHKAAIKSYLRAVAASGITVALAIVGDMKPEYAVLLGAVIAPLIKALDVSEKDFGLTEKL
jgi:5,10-methylenetetrahydrofolate reductase